MADLSLNKDPNARVLDHGRLKITVQTKSSHRLPTESELYASFSKFGDCIVEQIGKSNQFIVKYRVANAGNIAAKKLYKQMIGGIWTIDSIKYGWSSYCPSMFYPQSSNLSICSKGSKCSKIHRFKQHHEAFTVIGNPETDQRAFQLFKQERLRRCHDVMAVQFVEDIHDFNNMEGVVQRQPSKLSQSTHPSQPTTNTRRSPQKRNTGNTGNTGNTRRTHMTRTVSIDSVDSSSSSSSFSPCTSAMQPRAVPAGHSPTKQPPSIPPISLHNTNGQNGQRQHCSSSSRARRPHSSQLSHSSHQFETEEQKKNKIRDLLRQQLERGVSPNTQIMQKDFVPLPTPPPSSRRRQSPPAIQLNGQLAPRSSSSNPSETLSIRSNRSNISIPSQRSARSTVVGMGQDGTHHTRKTLDYSSSSSASTSPIYPVKRGIFSQRTVETKSSSPIGSGSNGSHGSGGSVHSKKSRDWNILNEEDSKSSSVTPPTSRNTPRYEQSNGKRQIVNSERSNHSNAHSNVHSKPRRQRYIPPNQRVSGSRYKSTNQLNQTQPNGPNQPPNRSNSTCPRTPPNMIRRFPPNKSSSSVPPANSKGIKLSPLDFSKITPRTAQRQNPPPRDAPPPSTKHTQNEMKQTENWDQDISREISRETSEEMKIKTPKTLISQRSTSGDSFTSLNTEAVERSIITAVNSVLGPLPSGASSGNTLTKVPIIDPNDKTVKYKYRAAPSQQRTQPSISTQINPQSQRTQSQNVPKQPQRKGNVIKLHDPHSANVTFHKHSVFASNTKHQKAFAPSSPLKLTANPIENNGVKPILGPMPNSTINSTMNSTVNSTVTAPRIPMGMTPLNATVNGTVNPVHLNMLNAPPFIPTSMIAVPTLNTVPPAPTAVFPTYMPSLNGMTGNLLAGTLQPAHHPNAHNAHSNSNGNHRNMRNTNCAQNGMQNGLQNGMQNGWKSGNQMSAVNGHNGGNRVNHGVNLHPNAHPNGHLNAHSNGSHSNGSNPVNQQLNQRTNPHSNAHSNGHSNPQSNPRSNPHSNPRSNRSIATTSLSDHSKGRYNEPHRILQNEEYEQRKQSKLQMLAQPVDKDSAKYKFQYEYDLSTPTKLKDYHWICYHYKSGEDYSCRFGNQCRWRHYDFQNRRDIQTAWDLKESVANAPEPGVKEIKEAQELRNLIGQQFPYVFEKNDSLNPFINNNPTPPSTKKRRIQNHERNELKEQKGDQWTERIKTRVNRRLRRKLIMESKQQDASFETLTGIRSPTLGAYRVEPANDDVKSEEIEEEEVVQITPPLPCERDEESDGVQVLSAESKKQSQREVDAWMRDDDDDDILECESIDFTPDIPCEPTAGISTMDHVVGAVQELSVSIPETQNGEEQVRCQHVDEDEKGMIQSNGLKILNNLDHAQVPNVCQEAKEKEERKDEDDYTQDSDCDTNWCQHVHNAESAINEDKEKPLVEVDKEERMLRAGDFSTLLAMMTPFNNPRHSEVDYYVIGKFAAQQLQQLIAAKK